MSTPARRRCHYEVLGVSRDAGDDELKRVYRQLALKMHPDKNRDVDPETAKEAFQELQAAYEVLSDPQERAWYDAHREAILQGKGVGGSDDGDVDVGGADLFPFFSSSCFRGFGDGDGGFYAVYRALFATINEEDQGFSDEPLHYPSFGDSQSADEAWQSFYAFFSAYITPRSYSWLDKYDTRQAENRRVVRAMEKENKKIREAARKERSELVRELVRFVRRRDRRLVDFNRRLEEQRAANARKTEEARMKQLDRRAEMLKEAMTAGGQADDRLEDQLQMLEDAYDTEEEDEENYCVACNKQLRSAKAFAGHLRQRKHLDNVRALREAMAEQEEDVGGVEVDLRQLGIHDDDEDEVEDVEDSAERKKKKKGKKGRNAGAEEAEEEPSGIGRDGDEDGGEENGDDEKMEVQEGEEEEEGNSARGKGKKKKKNQKASQKVIPVVKDAQQTNGAPQDKVAGSDEKEEVEVAKPKAKVKKSRRANKENRDREAAGRDEGDDEEEARVDGLRCAVCKNDFASKNKLFAHLKSSGHSVYLGEAAAASKKGKKKR